MREYTQQDLFRLSRGELMRLEHQMVEAMTRLPAHAPDRTLATINQRRIRRELGRREWGLFI